MKEPTLQDILAELKKLKLEIRELRKERKTSPDELLNVSETARIIGLSERTIRKRTAPKAKEPFPLQPVRQGKRVNFRRQDIDQYLAGLGAD